MKKLIEALTIFAKYKDVNYPTHCEHDVLMIAAVTEDEVSSEDKQKLDDLGFHWSKETDCWISYRFGSA